MTLAASRSELVTHAHLEKAPHDAGLGAGRIVVDTTILRRLDWRQRVEQVLGLRFRNGETPVETVLEWGVRKLEVPVEVSGERDVAASAKADMFPAYDDDGGLLLVLTPDK